jgi:hypothetical protein
MFSIIQETVPEDSLLKTYRGGSHPERWGEYGDCFAVTIGYPVSLSDFVSAFYTSPLFRVERLLLRIVVNAPSSGRQARAVAEGSAVEFAVWYVGERTATQLLMCDRYGRTRSWFCVAPVNGGTRLRFGSAVAAARGKRAGAKRPGGSFPWLLRFHVLYSQLLLHAAKMQLGAAC